MARTNAYRPQSAFSVNGIWFEDEIQGYHTLNTKNRYLLEKQLTLRESSKTDGAVLTRSRFPYREIEVEYMIEGADWDAFQTSYAKLMRYLDTENAVIIFNGEPDKYVIGSFVAPQAVDESQATRSGTYKIVCADPFKYSVNEYAQAAVSNEWSITYDGTYPSHPRIVFDFPVTRDANGNNTATSECGYVGLSTQTGAMLQFGDPKETDWGSITEPATKPIDKAFSTQDWTLNNAKTLGANYVEAGTMGVNATDKFVYPSGYGSGTAFHGPSISKTFTNSTHKNWQFTWKQLFNFASGQKAKQFGCFTALVFNNQGGTRTLLGAIGLEKVDKNDKTRVYFYGNDNYTAKNAKKPLKIACNDVRTCSIKKQGKTLTFNIAGKSDTLELSDTISNKYANEVVFFFGQQKTNTALATNRLYNCTMELFSYTYKGDIQNAFLPGQILTVDTAKAEVFLDSGDSTTPANELGALGNDWEDFALMPGANLIGAEYSTFTTTPPTATMYYRKVYL